MVTTAKCAHAAPVQNSRPWPDAEDVTGVSLVIGECTACSSTIAVRSDDARVAAHVQRADYSEVERLVHVVREHDAVRGPLPYELLISGGILSRSLHNAEVQRA